MNKPLALTLALPLLLSLSACGSASNSSSAQPSDTKSVSVPLTIASNENGPVPSLCSDYFQQGTLCTTDVSVTSTSKDPFDMNITVKAHDDQGRTYNAQNDATDTSNIAEFLRFSINPGESLAWGLEFSVSKGTHLTSIDFYQDGEKFKTVSVDLKA